MFFPIGDTPNPKDFKPWVNWALIAVNVIVYFTVALPLSHTAADPADVAQYLRSVMPDVPWWLLPHAAQDLLRSITAYEIFVFKHGYKPGAPELSDLLTCMFLHANFAHLAGNMLFLWIFGDNVEHRLGRIRYLLAYMITGIVATLTFSWFATRPLVPLVGASGAISGVVGFYYVFFPRNRVRTFVFLFPFIMDVWLIPVRWVIGIYILVDNLLPFIIGAESGVAYGAHLGGFVAGVLGALAGERLTALFGWRPRGRPSAIGAEDALVALRGAIQDGEPRKALTALLNLRRTDLALLSADEAVTLAAWLEEAGYPQTASRFLRQYAYALNRPQDLAEVHLKLGLLRLRQGQQAAAFQHLLRVFDYDPDPFTAARAREALDTLDIDPRLLKRFSPRE